MSSNKSTLGSRWLKFGQQALDWIGRSGLAELTVPPECVFCQTALGSDGGRLCEVCLKALVPRSYCCQRCAMPLSEALPNHDCSRCRDTRWNFANIVALGPYRGKLREAVILCKKLRSEHLRYALAEQLAIQLIDRFPFDSAISPVIIPVPYHWTRAFARTAASANSLAELIGHHTGWPVLSRVARRIRRTAKQGMLSLAERKQNVRGAFQLNKADSLAGKHVFIVDDVVTTGATVNELAKKLRPAKPAKITVVAVARATGN